MGFPKRYVCFLQTSFLVFFYTLLGVEADSIVIREITRL